ncbi:MAG: NAD(P)H-hydrate dehydratase [Opitutaceae bacterium]|nr:NAD(P)H-hydrate dehydratase [Opitutaceae bacterium]
MERRLRIVSRPVLSCQEAGEFEANFFRGDETLEWRAMQQAGRSLANAIAADSGEIGGWGGRPRFLILVGKGHNGGDALIAADLLLAQNPGAHADVVFLFGERSLRPLTRRAWISFQRNGFNRSAIVHSTERLAPGYDLVVDGVFGFQFRPPLSEGVALWLERINALDVRLRAAVDLPSGLGETKAFRADFSYATGITKTPLLTIPNAGRIRHLDLGWDVPSGSGTATRVLMEETLAPLTRLRDSRTDKRSYGHLGVVGGSLQYPGAVLMTVRAALQGGCGLLTAFVPDSLVASFAAAVPEAMWVGWPETPEGGLAMEGAHVLRRRLERLTALVVGPGLGREVETLACIASEMRTFRFPVLIDADALQPNIVTAGDCAKILTPHAGEFARIGEGLDLESYVRRHQSVVVLKGPITRVASGEIQYCSPFGGPVLARGGSGDLLSGIIGSLLAQNPESPLEAAATGVVWQGCAADVLARAHGATAVTATQILGCLSGAIRRSPASGYL